MKVDLRFDIMPCPCIGYLPQCQEHPLLKKLHIRNNGDTLENITLQICSTSKALMPFETELRQLEADTVTVIDLQLNSDYLSEIFHKLTTEMVIHISKNGQLLYSQAVQFDVIPLQPHCDFLSTDPHTGCDSLSKSRTAAKTMTFGLEMQVNIV